MRPAGTPGRRRGWTGQRTGEQDRRSPIGAVWSGCPVPAPAPPQWRAWATARRCSPATSWPASPNPAGLLPPLAMRAALLPSDYYGGSATPGCRQPTAGLPAAVLAARREGRHPGASHVHDVPVGGGGAQLFPGSLATPTPQPFSVASPPAQLAGVEVALPSARACAHCCPAHIHQVGAGSGLTGV